MPRRLLLGCTLAGLFCCLLASLPAPLGAEIYRWTDASGEHFTTELSKVPPEHRPAAWTSAVPESPPDPAPEVSPALPAPGRAPYPVEPAAPAAAAPAAPAADAMQSDACRAARARAIDLRRKLESLERQAERAQDAASNIRLSASSRAYSRARADRYQDQVQDAQQALFDHEREVRRSGLPPGCLR